MTLTFLSSLKAIPAEVLEAAAVDGASKVQSVLARGCSPTSCPPFVVMTLMSTFWTFNNFVYVWLTTGGRALGSPLT